MALFIIAVIVIAIILAFKFGSTSGQVVGEVKGSGGMHVKYDKLIGHILAAHKDSKIFVETRTYIRVGVMNYGGTTLFHIQQSTGNKVLIQYEVKDNPVFPSFQLEWTFPDDMNQDEMIVKMAKDIKNRTEKINNNGMTNDSTNNQTVNTNHDMHKENSVNGLYVNLNLDFNQKLAAMTLMKTFGGTCAPTKDNLAKINHIMTVVGTGMCMSPQECSKGYDAFPTMVDSVNALKGADRHALGNIFWALFCIVQCSNDLHALQCLITVYSELGFTQEDCIKIIERISGRNII